MSDNSGLQVILKDDETTEFTINVCISGKPETTKSATLKLVRILKGFWLNENDEELTQTDGLNKNVVYGQKVKVKLLTSHTKDGDIIEVEIKAKKGEEYIDIDDEQESLKLTLKAKNNEAISEPFYLNPKWYNEDKENYNYDTHQTEIDPKELLTFIFDAKYKGQDKKHGRIDLPKDDTSKLKPIAYLRNYEELIGLFNTDNTGEKNKEQNYENKFIDTNSEIKTIVDEFIEKVITQEITIEEIKTLVEEKAKALWDTSVKQVQSGNLDDRPLYWARNKMQTWLKRNPLFIDQIDIGKSLVKKETELDNIIILFEELSRNYTGIDFSKAGNKKKVLITGFDPFQLNPDIDFNSSMGANSATTFNPSGIIALCFNGFFEDYYIQTCIFPVRYDDFDKGFVENVIKSNITDVDLIMTTSLNGGNPRFDIEKFATEFRGGFHDNLGIGNSDNQYDSSRFIVNQSQNYTETTLPNKKIFEDKTSITIKGNEIYFDTNRSPKEGSGSNYLSNEIMYRSTKVRDEIDLKTPVGHFHLGNLSSISRANEVKNVVFEIIKKILK